MRHTIHYPLSGHMSHMRLGGSPRHESRGSRASGSRIPTASLVFSSSLSTSASLSLAPSRLLARLPPSLSLSLVVRWAFAVALRPSLWSAFHGNNSHPSDRRIRLIVCLYFPFQFILSLLSRSSRNDLIGSSRPRFDRRSEQQEARTRQTQGRLVARSLNPVWN